MKLFLVGTFRTKQEEERLEEIYNLLIGDGHEVWWAPRNLKKRGYGSKDMNLIKDIIGTEESNIEKSDALVVVMERATFGTAMEIKHAFDKNIPVIALLLSDNPDFTSAALTYRVNRFVKSKEELIDAIRGLK